MLISCLSCFFFLNKPFQLLQITKLSPTLSHSAPSNLTCFMHFIHLFPNIIGSSLAILQLANQNRWCSYILPGTLASGDLRLMESKNRALLLTISGPQEIGPPINGSSQNLLVVQLIFLTSWIPYSAQLPSAAKNWWMSIRQREFPIFVYC